MGKIIRHEFLGSTVLFAIFCLSVIGIRVAIVYFATSLVTVEEEMEDPSAFVEKYRSGRLES